VGDPAGAGEILLGLRVGRGELGAEDFGEVLGRGALPLLLGGVLRPDRPQLAGVQPVPAAVGGARLWVIEQVLPTEDAPDPSERAGLTLRDLNMLVLFGGGQERTDEEYRQLLGAAGFDEVAVIPAEGTPWSVVEAVRR
jgi:hypothetical protein